MNSCNEISNGAVNMGVNVNAASFSRRVFRSGHIVYLISIIYPLERWENSAQILWQNACAHVN